MAFFEERLPFPVSRQSGGGPNWQTTVIQVDSGFEQRNQGWAEDLAKWDIGSFVRGTAEMAVLRAFFNKVAGRTHGFRVDDWQDNTSGPTTLGTGTGSLATFQLVKAYDPTGTAYRKAIKKPVAGSVVVTVAGMARVEGTHYDVNYATGLVTFRAGNLPAVDEVVTGACAFDKPARFDIDHLEMQHVHLPFATVEIPVVELRLP